MPLYDHAEARAECWVCSSTTLHDVGLRQGLSLNQQLGVLARLSDHQAHLSLPLKGRVTGTCSSVWLFMLGLGIQTRVFLLTQQVLLPMVPPPQPRKSLGLLLLPGNTTSKVLVVATIKRTSQSAPLFTRNKLPTRTGLGRQLTSVFLITLKLSRVVGCRPCL